MADQLLAADLRDAQREFEAHGVKVERETTVSSNTPSVPSLPSPGAGTIDSEQQKTQITTIAEAAVAADKATETISNLRGVGKNATQNEMSLNFARSMGSLETEIKTHQPFTPKEQEVLTEAVEQSTLAEEQKESLKEAVKEGHPLSEKQQEDLKLATKELADKNVISADEKKELDTVIERPLSQEQTQALVVAVEASQNLSTEQKDELVDALKEGKTLSDTQKTQINQAYEELQETILQLDLTDQKEIPQKELNQVKTAIRQSNTLSQEQKENLTKALDSDLRLTQEQKESLAALSKEEGVSVQQQQAIKKAVEDYRPLSEPQKDRIVEAVSKSDLLTETQKTDTTQKLEKGETLSTEDTKFATIALREAHYQKLEQAVEHPEQMTKPQQQELIKVVEEQVQGKEAETLTNAIKSGQELEPNQKEEINKALHRSLEGEVEQIKARKETHTNPITAYQISEYIKDLNLRPDQNVSSKVSFSFKYVDPNVWAFLEQDQEDENPISFPSPQPKTVANQNTEPQEQKGTQPTPRTIALNIPENQPIPEKQPQAVKVQNPSNEVSIKTPRETKNDDPTMPYLQPIQPHQPIDFDNLDLTVNKSA